MFSYLCFLMSRYQSILKRYQSISNYIRSLNMDDYMYMLKFLQFFIEVA